MEQSSFLHNVHCTTHRSTLPLIEVHVHYHSSKYMYTTTHQSTCTLPHIKVKYMYTTTHQSTCTLPHIEVHVHYHTSKSHRHIHMHTEKHTYIHTHTLKERDTHTHKQILQYWTTAHKIQSKNINVSAIQTHPQPTPHGWAAHQLQGLLIPSSPIPLSLLLIPSPHPQACPTLLDQPT